MLPYFQLAEISAKARPLSPTRNGRAHPSLPPGSALSFLSLSLSTSPQPPQPTTMPPVQPPSKMPKGLTPEEKKEYQKERNRKKQAALRARRAAKGKEEAEAASPSQSPPIASTSNDGSARPSPSALRGSWNSLDESTRVGFVEALARSHAEVARLTSTVGRLVGKLAELGIDDQTIGMLLREGSCGTPSSRQSPSSSLSSLAAGSSSLGHA